MDAYLTTLTINRVVGAIERRLGEALNIRANQFQDMDWPEITSQLLQEAEDLLERQFDRLLGEGKIIARDLDPLLDPLDDYTTDEGQLMDMLGVMMQGQRMVFDRKTPPPELPDYPPFELCLPGRADAAGPSRARNYRAGA